ncbi:MAG: hypothetical protein LC667_14675 [Thioalkalivibrio sp.]|nr:hypothetical protein [Thioalkalivibrio sp.]
MLYKNWFWWGLDMIADGAAALLGSDHHLRRDSDDGAHDLAAVLRDSPSPIPGLPADLAAVLARCLRKNPDERFPSAAELKVAVEACLAPAAAGVRPSIAVLPFTNMSGEGSDDYLCEGLAEEIINVLTRLPGLRVVARTSAFAVANMGLDVREAGARLDVTPHSPLVQLRHAVSCLMPRGRVEEAMVEIELILASDPLSLFVRWWLGVMAILARRFDRAIDEGRHMIALEPGYFLGHWTLGVGLQSANRTDEALPSLERAHELSGGIPFTLGFLAWAYGRAGRRGDSSALLTQIETAASRTYIPPFTFALAYAGLDDWDTAFVWMDRAVEARDPLIMPIRTYPFFDPLRSDPRFSALLDKMNLLTPGADPPAT